MKEETVKENKANFDNLIEEYLSIKPAISARLDEFREIWERGDDEDIFYELIFCLMTPQSKAELCWQASERIRKADIRSVKDPEEIQPMMKGVRFKYKKSEYILEAKDKFISNDKFILKDLLSGIEDIHLKREWILKNVKGIGYKEAGHFLRNIGFGESIAILDRHILKNLALFGVIDSIPGSVSGKKYLEIESKMKLFAGQKGIPMDHLDLLFWHREAGKIFK